MTFVSEFELHAGDYVIFVLFILISSGIGVFFSLFRGGQGDPDTFLMANRDLKLVPVAISMLASFFSAILLLGYPAEVYLNGISIAIEPFGIALACGLAIVLFVPLFFSLKLTSAFEYLELRYRSKIVRLLGNCFFLLSAIVYMGIAMFAPSAAMAKMTQMKFPVFGSIVLCGAIGTFYTTLGGIKAVVWTDVFQACVMLTGLLAIIIKGTIEVGGVGKVFELNQEHNRLNFGAREWSFDPEERHTTWGLVFGKAIFWLSIYGVNQASVQRFCALPTLRKAQLSVLLNIPGAMLFMWFACAAGMVIFAVYANVQCDIHDIGWAGKNVIVPYFIMDHLYFPTVPGIFLASLFSGALSSVSSSLNACSAITWKDILEPWVFTTVSERKAAMITKLLVLIYGVLGTSFGCLASRLGGNIHQISASFYSAFGAPTLGIFLLGALFPYANKWGAIFGGLSGVVMNLWISIGAYSLGKQKKSLSGDISNCYNSTNATSAPPTTAAPTCITSSLYYFYSISYLWYSAIGVAVTIGVGLMVTGLTGSMKDIDSKYVLPICNNLCRYCPKTRLTSINYKISSSATLNDDNSISMSNGIEMNQTSLRDSHNSDVRNSAPSKETIDTKKENEDEDIYDHVDMF